MNSTPKTSLKKTVKIRFENLRIKLKKMKLTSEDGEDSKNYHYFTSPTGEKKEISKGLKEFFNHLDGTLEIREILRLLFHKGETVFITEAVDWLQYLLELELIENPENLETVLSSLKAETSSLFRTNRGEVQTTTEHKAAYFSKDRLLSILRKTTLFYQTDHRLLSVMIDSSEVKQFDSNDFVLKKDEQADDILVLLTGSVGVFPDFKNYPQKIVAFFTYQNVFGESAALLNKKRNADVLALESSFILKIPISKLAKDRSKLQSEDLGNLKARVLLNQVLSSNPLFSKVPTDVLQFLLLKCSIERHPLGDIIIHEGQKDGSIYFILKGEVEVLKGSLSLATLKTGEYFGEISALTSNPRTASVLSLSETLLLRLHQSDLFDFMIKDIKTGLAIESEMIARYSEISRISIKNIDIAEENSNLHDISLDGQDIDELSRVNWDNLSLNFSAYGKSQLDRHSPEN